MSGIVKLLAMQTVLVKTDVPDEYPEDGDWVDFQSPVDEEDSFISKELVFRTSDWEDMGSPECVTVTIEPGDKLNVRDSG